MKDSKIEWTDHTFNPWIGCSEVSPGCKHCYAKQLMDIRFGKAKWGPNGTRDTTTSAWDDVRKINRKAGERGIRQRIFCASLADVFEFHPRITHDTRRRLFELIEESKNLDWLLLTKRPENIAEILSGSISGRNWMKQFHNRFSHVMLGASVENQECANERIPHLRFVPGRHFLSIEPLLSPIDLVEPFSRYLSKDIERWGLELIEPYLFGKPSHHRIDWVIVGGESGQKSQKLRPMNLDWVRSIRDQCRKAGVPFFMKQLGGSPNRSDLADFPEDLRIREFPDHFTKNEVPA